MRRQPSHRLPRFQALSSLTALSLLTACGGGGVSSPTTLGTATVITGSVTNPSGAPVVDATVTLGTASGPPVATQSDLNGNYALPVDIATVNTATVVVVTVAKEGYKTCTGTVNPGNGTVSGCETLPPASVDELHPAPADAVLTRLGDGEVTGGATNSKLQMATPAGLTKTVLLGWPANFDLTAFQTFTVNVSLRGMQATACADKITVLQGASPVTTTAVQVFSAQTSTLADSNPLGGFSAYALQVPAASLNAAGGDVYVKMEAGVCTDGTPADPADDYEFVGLYGKFS